MHLRRLQGNFSCMLSEGPAARTQKICPEPPNDAEPEDGVWHVAGYRRQGWIWWSTGFSLKFKKTLSIFSSVGLLKVLSEMLAVGRSEQRFYINVLQIKQYFVDVMGCEQSYPWLFTGRAINSANIQAATAAARVTRLQSIYHVWVAETNKKKRTQQN